MHTQINTINQTIYYAKLTSMLENSNNFKKYKINHFILHTILKI